MDDRLRIRVLIERLRLLIMQLESGNLSRKDFEDLFSEDQTVAEFLRGELKLREDYMTSLRSLASQGNIGAQQATSSVHKQFNPGEIEKLVKK